MVPVVVAWVSLPASEKKHLGSQLCCLLMFDFLSHWLVFFTFFFLFLLVWQVGDWYSRSAWAPFLLAAGRSFYRKQPCFGFLVLANWNETTKAAKCRVDSPSGFAKNRLLRRVSHDCDVIFSRHPGGGLSSRMCSLRSIWAHTLVPPGNSVHESKHVNNIGMQHLFQSQLTHIPTPPSSDYPRSRSVNHWPTCSRLARQVTQEMGDFVVWNVTPPTWSQGHMVGR